MKTSTFFNTVLFCFLTAVTIAQKAEEPNYRYDVGAKINEMTLTQGGTMVVATNDGLVGIKPGSNNLLFNFTDYGRVKPEELYFVPNAPYVMIGQAGFIPISTKKAVIDYMSGKKLFSTEDNGWKAVYTCDVMMPQNKLVVSGQRKAEDKYASAVAVYDLNTGKQENYITLKGAEIVSGRPLLLKDALIVPTTKNLMKINLASGAVEWSAKVDDIKWMVADKTEKEIYGFEITPNGGNTKVHKIASNGSLLWKDAHKVKGYVVNFEILPQGLAIVSNVDNSDKGMLAGSSESKIAFLSATNGEDLWEKAPKTKGFVQHFYVMEDGILFGIYEGGINKISFDGTTLFKKPLKTGANILTMADTPQGLIYITSEDANIVNLSTGDQVWSKPLKYKRAEAISSTFDSKNSRYLISADEQLYSVDANTGEVSTLAESKFEGKEAPSHIEVRDGGLLLTSDQNMMMLNQDGSQTWHEFYQAPGKSAMGAILAGATAVASIAGAAAAANSFAQNRLMGYNSQADRDSELAGNLGAAAGASITEMLKRFKATAATKDSQFVLTKLEEGVGLVKLNKDTGTKEKEIILKDKKPEYQVDEIGGMLYYKADDNSIYAYDLRK